MTLNAFEHARMDRMAEGCSSGFLELENHIYRRFMACAAIALYAKYGRTVMTGATRSSLFHLGHGVAFIIRTGIVQLVMTIGAGVQGQVFVMVKSGVVRKQHFLDRVAFTARFDTERSFTVMAGSA